MDNQIENSTQKTSLLARMRSHRLSTTFVLLGTLSVGILVGSVITHGVSGKEQQSVDSSDARPLTIPDPRNTLEWLLEDRERGWPRRRKYQYRRNGQTRHGEEGSSPQPSRHPTAKPQRRRLR